MQDQLLHVGLPPIKEATEPLWVPGLLDEKVDLPLHRESAVIFDTVQLLVHPQQSPLRHRVVLGCVVLLPLFGLVGFGSVAVLKLVGLDDRNVKSES